MLVVISLDFAEMECEENDHDRGDNAKEASESLIEVAELGVVEGKEHVAEGLVHESNGIGLFRDTVSATWFSCQTR